MGICKGVKSVNKNSISVQAHIGQGVDIGLKVAQELVDLVDHDWLQPSQVGTEPCRVLKAGSIVGFVEPDGVECLVGKEGLEVGFVWLGFESVQDLLAVCGLLEEFFGMVD